MCDLALVRWAVRDGMIARVRCLRVSLTVSVFARIPRDFSTMRCIKLIAPRPRKGRGAA